MTELLSENVTFREVIAYKNKQIFNNNKKYISEPQKYDVQNLQEHNL